MSQVRPREGARITVLLEVEGTPVTHQARAGRIDANSMIVPMRREDPRWRPDVGCPALVLFLHDGVLQAWSTRVEEVLPSSYYLIGDSDVAVSDRRAFVRAELRLLLAAERVEPSQALQRLEQPAPPLLPTNVDLSASGIRLRGDPSWQPGDILALWLGRGQDPENAEALQPQELSASQPNLTHHNPVAKHVVQAIAVVIRRLPGAELDCACELEQLDSAAEDWLIRQVYQARGRDLGLRTQPNHSLRPPSDKLAN